MLDDRQLEKLIRMAAEVEAMDALASKQPSLRLAGQPARAEAPASRWRIGRRWTAVITVAAAACVAALVVPGGILTAFSGGSGAGSGPGIAGPGPENVETVALENPMLWSGDGAAWPPALPWPLRGLNGGASEQVAEGDSDVRGALLTILEDDAGHVECVQWAPHDWGQSGNSLAEVKASDLVALSLMMTCDRTPRRMTVVGLRGPASELPLGDARAAELAQCIVKAPARCSSMTCCNPGASTECIPEDVNVRFERVSFR